MSGALLTQVLNQGLANKGSGGFLQTAGVSQTQDSQNWLVGDRPLDSTTTYRVAISAFLLSGKETGLDYLTPDHPDITVLPKSEDQQNDIRFALIRELQRVNN